MNNIRVLFFISTLDGGGTERVLVNLVNQLDSSVFDITIKCLLGGGENETDINKSVHVSSIVRIRSLFFRRIAIFFFYKLMAPSLFHKIFIGNRYDIEIAYDSGYPTKIIWASNCVSSRKICFLHGNIKHYPQYEKIYGSKLEAIKQYKKMDKVCFVSEDNQKNFFKEYQDTGNTIVIHNVMDIERIINCSERLVNTEYDPKKINIVSVGRMVSVKGYDRLLKAINNIGSKDDSYTVTLIGSGSSKEQYMEYVKNNNMDWVRFIDYQKNPFPYVKNADLFFCSSYSEGYSTAVAESVLVGTPVITTDCPGMNEIFSDNLGGRIVENTEEGIQNSLETYLNNTEYRKALKDEAMLKKVTFREEMKNNIHTYETLLKKCYYQ